MATVLDTPPDAAVSDAPPKWIGLESAGMLMTPPEFDAVEDYDDLYDYELIHGVLVVHAIPKEAEAGPNELLGYLLLKYQEEHQLGHALDDTLPERYIRTADSRRKADRVIWAGLGRRPNPRTDVPTIAVEFVSTGRRNRRRDYEEKRREYLAVGVKEYWIIDRFARTLTVFRDPALGQVEQVVLEREAYRPELLPGFEVPLARLLAKADEWEEST
jgi:Uma2 family endonuclease